MIIGTIVTRYADGSIDNGGGCDTAPASLAVELSRKSPDKIVEFTTAAGVTCSALRRRPEHLRNNGFALEPGVNGSIDDKDEEQTAYAEMYKNVKAIEAIITAAKATKGPF